MFAESRPKGARLLDAEARLRRLFAAGTADEAAVSAAVADVEIPTEGQRRAHHEARWPGR